MVSSFLPRSWSRTIKGILQLLTLVLVVTGLVSFLLAELEPSSLAENPSPSPETTSLKPTATISGSLEMVQVERVVDGDTIRLVGGKTLRYIGIDTPETVAPGKPIECFGNEASEFNKTLVEGKTLWLEKDISETDRYGRLLRYVYLDPDASLSAQVSYQLVLQGYANASSYPPDIKWQEELREAENEARNAGRGLWENCSLEEKL